MKSLMPPPDIPHWDGAMLCVDWLLPMDGKGGWLHRKPPGCVRISRLSFLQNSGLVCTIDPTSLSQGQEQGLVYLDAEFLAGLRKKMHDLGFPWESCMDFDYSEQGMQPMDGVHFDAGKLFAASWVAWRSVMDHGALARSTPCASPKNKQRL